MEQDVLYGMTEKSTIVLIGKDFSNEFGAAWLPSVSHYSTEGLWRITMHQHKGGRGLIADAIMDVINNGLQVFYEKGNVFKMFVRPQA